MPCSPGSPTSCLSKSFRRNFYHSPSRILQAFLYPSAHPPKPLELLTHLRHNSLTLESPPDTVVNALRLPPAGVDAFEAVALVAVEGRSLLLDDGDVLLCGDHLCAGETRETVSAISSR